MGGETLCVNCGYPLASHARDGGAYVCTFSQPPATREPARDELLNRAVASRGKPANVDEWSRKLAGDACKFDEVEQLRAEVERLRGDWCDVCKAPQYVTPDGEHHCGESRLAEAIANDLGAAEMLSVPYTDAVPVIEKRLRGESQAAVAAALERVRAILDKHLWRGDNCTCGYECWPGLDSNLTRYEQWLNHIMTLLTSSDASSALAAERAKSQAAVAAFAESLITKLIGTYPSCQWTIEAILPEIRALIPNDASSALAAHDAKLTKRVLLEEVKRRGHDSECRVGQWVSGLRVTSGCTCGLDARLAELRAGGGK